MYVCLCKGVTDSQIREAVNGGAESFREVKNQLGAATGCGRCACDVRDLVKATLESDSDNALFFEVA
ncbi:Bacterioferritin-associated ferredoxin [Thalassocella blandensis]|nr:Bacterioferritin-associated ferredoxin [Thalassocella blandensis]